MKVWLHIEENGEIGEGVHQHGDVELRMSVDDLLSLTPAERLQLASYAKRSGPRLSVERADVESVRRALRRERERDEQLAHARDAACRELNAYAMEHFPDLVRSVQEGYNVAGGTVLKLAEAIRNRIYEREFPYVPTIVRHGTSMYHDLRFTVREEPWPTALELRDRVVEHVSRLTKDWPTCVEAVVSAVVRIEDFATGRPPEKSTGVVVTLRCPATADFLIVIRSE